MAYRIVILMTTLILFTGCGGGGGGGGGSSSGGNGGGNGGNSLPAVLEVDSFDSETYFASISLYGSLNSQYWAPIDCDNPANFTPSVIATVRWRNVTTGETGETSIVIFCRDSGTIFGVGVHTDWSINSGLAIGVNQIVLDTYEGNTRIGTQTVSVTRNDANNILTDTVITSEGTLKGLNEQFDLVVFRGVPYAAPPTGNRRFKAPEPPLAYSGTLDATHFSDVCLQQSGASVTGSEDCLYLNIWAHRDDEIRPVFVFLHGGGGGGVGGDMAATRGNALAHNADTIVVTLNRRMGILGSLAIQELVDENPRSTAGNYSVLDVIAALKWLKANIAEFNGDPNRIMLAGESAGGLLMCHILASPDAAGLFQSAAIQSGPCSLLAKVLDNSINENSLAPPLLQLHAPILAETGCHVAGDPLTCLRQTTGSELFAAAAGVQQASGFVGSIFTPNIDGEVVVSNPLSALENNVVGNIPLIVGANDDEGGAVLGGQVPTLDDAGYRNALLNFWDQSTADALYDLYPSSEYPTPTDAYRTLFGDLGINCVAEQLANAAKGGAPSYLYTLTRGFDKLSGGNTGAVHGVDVPYLFLTSGAFGYDTDTQSTAISQAMWRGWIGLAENPNVAPMLTSQITWPAFDSINRPYAEFGEVIDARSNHREGRCPQLAAILN